MASSKAKENEQRKGRRKLSLSEFLDIAVARCHRTCGPTSILPSIRKLSKNDVGAHKDTPRNSTRFPNNLVVESRKDEDKPGPNINPEKDDIVIAVDNTGIKVTNYQNSCCCCKHKDKEDGINECNKRRCL
jgi:hypothetical protein